MQPENLLPSFLFPGGHISKRLYKYIIGINCTNNYTSNLNNNLTINDINNSIYTNNKNNIKDNNRSYLVY